MVKPTVFERERLPAASAATKPARNVPGLSLRLPSQPLNHLVLLPATPAWRKRPTRR